MASSPLRSRTLSLIVTGTPSATPDAVPNDVVRSLRTTPDSVSTLTPFEPSPGYGPAVSSGISRSATWTDPTGAPAAGAPPAGGPPWALEDVTVSGSSVPQLT